MMHKLIHAWAAVASGGRREAGPTFSHLKQTNLTATVTAAPDAFSLTS
jgi:hypothetical protein